MNATKRNREAGSAYIIALMTLVVLSILGLGLAFITQTEMQIGSGERTLQKAFYAADTGVQTAIARAIVEKKLEGFTMILKDNEKAVLGFQHEVTTSPFFPLLNAPCNLCEINDPGEYGHERYSKVNFGETPTAVRKNAFKTSDALASKTLSTLVEIQPYQLSPSEVAPIVQDPNAISKLKF